MGHSVSKFRSLPLTSYEHNPLAMVDPVYCATRTRDSTNAKDTTTPVVTKLHVRQSGAVSLLPSPDATLTVTDDRGAVVFHLDGSPHLLLPHHAQHLHSGHATTGGHKHSHSHLSLPRSHSDLETPAPPSIMSRPSDLHMTNVYGDEILHIHAEPASGPPSPASDSHPHLPAGDGDVSPPGHADHPHSLAASGRSSSRSSMASFSHHVSSHKLDALASFPVFSIHRPANSVAPPSPMWDRVSMNSFDAVMLACAEPPDNTFLALPPPTLPPPRSSASSTSHSNSTAQTHRLAALWSHDPTLCMHVEATKLNLHSHSVTLAVSCPRNGTLFVKAATDAPVTFIFSGHPSHGGLLVARAYRMPPTAADLARSTSFTAAPGSSPAAAAAAAAASARHATPSPSRSASLSRSAKRTHSPAPPTTSKQTKPPPTLSRSAELFTVDVAPGVDTAGIVALCVIAEALRAHLVVAHVRHNRDAGASGGFFNHTSMSRKPSAASDRSSLRSPLEFGAPPGARGTPPLVPAAPARYAGPGSRAAPALTRSNSVPFDSLAGILDDPPVLSTSAPPPPMLDNGAGAYVSPLVARLRAEETAAAAAAGGRRDLRAPDTSEPPPRAAPGTRRSSNPGPIRWAAEMFRHKDKAGKKSKRDKRPKDEGSASDSGGGSTGTSTPGSPDKIKGASDPGGLAGSQKVAKSSASLVPAGS